MSEIKQYAQRDLLAMDIAGNHYCRHVDHMTREKLHSKSDIAAELGWRDMQIAKLTAERDALAAEAGYLRGEIKQHSESVHFCGVCGKDDPCKNDDVCWSLNHPTPATDAYLNSVRAEVIKQLHSEQKEWALVTWQYDSFDALKRAAVRHGDSELSGVIFMLDRIEGFAAQLRAGEQS